MYNMASNIPLYEFAYLPLTGRRLDNYMIGLQKAYGKRMAPTLGINSSSYNRSIQRMESNDPSKILDAKLALKNKQTLNAKRPLQTVRDTTQTVQDMASGGVTGIRDVRRLKRTYMELHDDNLDALGITMLSKARGINNNSGQLGDSLRVEPIFKGKKAVGVATIGKRPLLEGMSGEAAAKHLGFAKPVKSHLNEIDFIGHPKHQGSALRGMRDYIESRPNEHFMATPATDKHGRVYQKALGKLKTGNVFLDLSDA